MATRLTTLLSLLLFSSYTHALAFDEHFDFVKRGTTSDEDKPWVPPESSQSLLPAIAPTHRFNDVAHLSPKNNLTLFFAPDDRGPLTGATVSTLQAEFIYKAVALEHCGAIENVQCSNNNKMVITLSNKKAVETIEKTWPHRPFVLITYHAGCPTASYKEGARSYYVVDSRKSTWKKGKYQITAHIVERELHEILKGGTLEWGSWKPSNNHRYKHKKHTPLPRKPKHGKPKHGKHPKHPKHPNSTKHPKSSKQPQTTKTTDYPTGTGIRTSGPTSFTSPIPSGVLVGDCRNDACLSALQAAASYDGALDDKDGYFEDDTDGDARAFIDGALEGLGLEDADYYDHNANSDADEAAQEEAEHRIDYRKRALLQKRFSFSFSRLRKFIRNKIFKPIAKAVVSPVTDFIKEPNLSNGLRLVALVPGVRIVTAVVGSIVGPLETSGSKTYSLQVPSRNNKASNFKGSFEETPFRGEGDNQQNGIVLLKANNGNARFNVWCVGCGIQGELTIAGAASFDIGELRFTKGRVDVKGGLELQLAVGIEAQYRYSSKYVQNLLEVPISPFSIPKIATVGFTVTVGVVATFDANANGQLLAGFKLTWPETLSTIDFVTPSNTNLGAIGKPVFLPIFEAAGQIDLQASFGPSIGLNFGVSILPSFTSKLTLVVGLVDVPSLNTRATFTAANVALDGVECINGVQLEYSVINDLFVALNGAKKFGLSQAVLASGSKCISNAGTATTPVVDPALATVVAGPTGIEDGDDDTPKSAAPTLRRRRSVFLESRQYVNLTESTLSGESDVLNDTDVMNALDNKPSPEDFAMLAANLAAQPLDNGVDINGTDTADNFFALEVTPILSTGGQLAMIPGKNGDIVAINLAEAGTTADYAASWVTSDRQFIINDIDNRVLHLYSDELQDGGVSRIRLSPLEKMPTTSVVVRMINVDGRLVAADFEDGLYAMVLCGLQQNDLLLERIYAVNLKTFQESFAKLEGLKNGSELSGGEITNCSAFPWHSSLVTEAPLE